MNFFMIVPLLLFSADRRAVIASETSLHDPETKTIALALKVSQDLQISWLDCDARLDKGGIMSQPAGQSGTSAGMDAHRHL
jgi:hypothetical protein